MKKKKKGLPKNFISDFFKHLESERKKAKNKFKGIVFDNLEELLKNEYPNDTVIKDNGQFYLNKVSEDNKAKIPANYHCLYCGVVKGMPNTKYINTIGFLSGRAGTVTYCGLCNNELSFHGSHC